MTLKCLGKDRNNENCRNNQLDDSEFCKFHQYMNDYSKEMLDNLSLCSGCKKMYYLPENKQCKNCKNRALKNRTNAKDEKIICKKDNCIFEKSNDNDYCGKHQKEYFKEETELLGKKICINYIRGCYTQMNKTDNYSRCLKCREKERVGYNKKDDIINDELNVLDEFDDLEKELNLIGNKSKKNNIIIVDNDKIKDEEFNIEKKVIIKDENQDNIIKKNKNTNLLPEHYFIPEYMTDTTNLILDIIANFEFLNIDFSFVELFMEQDYKINKIMRYINATKQTDKYILEDLIECNNSKCKKLMPKHCYIDKFNRLIKNCCICRLHGQIKSNRETRKQSKAKWKEVNYDKCALYWQNFRGRKIEEKGVEKYLEDNAKTMKKWRDKNPDKTKVANEQKKENISIHYQNYVRDANKKNLEFELSFEDFSEIVKQVCYYCGEIQEKGLNGIDKMNCNNGYIKKNCVSCCEMCNFIKGTLTPDVFLKRIEHILTHQGYINGKLYSECFANHMSSDYNRYKKRADDKSLNFEITEGDFYSLIMEKCYICGKKSEGEHINGIDRIDNEKGYIQDNIEACCGECNYMKNKFSLNDFFDKLRKIKKHKLIEFEIVNSKFKYQNIIDQRQHYNKIKLMQTTEELKLIYKEKQRIKKQNYRNSIKIQNNDIMLKNSDNNNNDNNNDIVDIKTKHLNKKTPEQLKEEARIRKQKQRDKLKEKYGDEEYKKKRALELAEYRKKKREEK